MRNNIRSGLLSLLFVGLSAGGVSADCANYITSQYGDGPASGTLLNSETRTVTLRGGGGWWIFNFGGSESVTYDVGYYDMGGGTIIQVDCRTYEVL